MGISLKQKIEEVVKYSSLYVGNSSATEERNIDCFNIDLPEEKIILDAMRSKKIILLTGEAGDGKSRMLKNVKVRNCPASFEYIDDFSALSEKEKRDIVKQLADVLKGSCDKRYLIAANIGIFTKYVLREESGLKLENFRESDACKIINFENRNLAHDPTLFKAIVKKFYGEEDYSCNYNECPLNGDCPFKQNLVELRKDIVIENIRVLCNAVFLMGKHITFREFLSLLSSLATGGCDCEQLQESPDIDISFYNIFEKLDGVVLDKIMNLDPAKVNVENDEDLFLFESCQNNLEEYKKEKRKNFFIKESENIYHKLSVQYLSEFLNVLQLINNRPYYFDVSEDNEALMKIKEGLVRLISPEKTVWEVGFFDMPIPIRERIKTKFSIDFNQLTLVWNHPDWKLDSDQSEIDHDNINFFYLSGVYLINDKPQSYSLRIDYTLFKYIYKAKENYYYSSSSNIFHEYGLFDFFKKILGINPKFSERIEILFEPGQNTVDFEMSFYAPNHLLGGKSNKKIKIKRLTGVN